MTIPGAFVAGVALPASDMNLLPAGVSGGGYAQVTANQATITTQVDLTSLTVTWTAVAGRRYRITGKCEVTATVADGTYLLALTDAGNVDKNRATDACLTTAARTITLIHSEVPGAGSITRKLRMQKVTGTGSLTMGASATAPAFILVEDLGV